MGACLRGLIAATCLTLMISGGLATFWAYFNFPTGEDHTLVPPENITYVSTDSSWDERNPTQEWIIYFNAKELSANYFLDSRLYVIIPGGVNTLTLLVLLLTSFFSRKVFTSSAVLYGATSLLAVNIAVAMKFFHQIRLIQENYNFSPYFFWILGFYVLQIVMLTFQVLIAGIDLIKEKTAWPTINFCHLFTPSIVLLSAEITFAAFSALCFCELPLRLGVIHKVFDDYSYSPKERIPDYYVFPSVIILVYGIVTSAESTLSHLFGNVHTRLMGVTSLLSGVLYCCVAIISSPSVLVIITGNSAPYYEMLMIFVLVGGLVRIGHGILCMVLPLRMASPPQMVKGIAEQILSAISLRLAYNGSYAKGISTLITVGDAAVLCRVIPLLLNQIFGMQEQLSTFKMLLHFIIEASLALAGAFAGFCSGAAVLIIDGVLKIAIFLLLLKSSPMSASQIKATLTNRLMDQSSKTQDKDLMPEEEHL